MKLEQAWGRQYLTVEEFEARLKEAQAGAWEQGVARGLDFASDVIAGRVPERAVNPFREARA